jgi:hypothetical protein
MTKQRGFTLIEVLMYTLIAGGVMLAGVALATTALRIRTSIRSTLILEENMRFASGRITNLVLEATGITTPVAGSPSSTLILTMPVPSLSPTIITLNGGVVSIAQGTGASNSLMSAEIKATRLTFTRVSSTTPIVQIELAATLANADATFPWLEVTTTADVRK